MVDTHGYALVRGHSLLNPSLWALTIKAVLPLRKSNLENPPGLLSVLTLKRTSLELCGLGFGF